MTIYLYPMSRFTGKSPFIFPEFELDLIGDNMNVIYKVCKMKLNVYILHTTVLEVWCRSGFQIKILY